MDETQNSVNDYITESYPGASMERRLKQLYEEATELTVSIGTRLELEQIINVVRHAWEKSQGETQHPAGEIADVRISLMGISSALCVTEQLALNDKMQKNRARSLADRQAREAAKQALGIFSEPDQSRAPS